MFSRHRTLMTKLDGVNDAYRHVKYVFDNLYDYQSSQKRVFKDLVKAARRIDTLQSARKAVLEYLFGYSTDVKMFNYNILSDIYSEKKQIKLNTFDIERINITILIPMAIISSL